MGWAKAEDDGMITPGAASHELPIDTPCARNASISLKMTAAQNLNPERERAHIDEILTTEDVLGVRTLCCGEYDYDALVQSVGL